MLKFSRSIKALGLKFTHSNAVLVKKFIYIPIPIVLIAVVLGFAPSGKPMQGPTVQFFRYGQNNIGTSHFTSMCSVYLQCLYNLVNFERSNDCVSFVTGKQARRLLSR